MKPFWHISLFGTLLCLLLAFDGHAQQVDNEDIWQMSGVVISEDSTSNGIFGVHIYSPASGRGTTSDFFGYFSFPVVNGDSLVVSAVGYERQTFIVPDNQDRDFSVLIELKEDTTILPEITVFPYPTEMAFRRAVLALNLPNEDQYSNVRTNLETSMMLARMEALEMGPEANHRWFMQQQHFANTNRFAPPTLSLLNPFAWAQFINDLKRREDR